MKRRRFASLFVLAVLAFPALVPRADAAAPPLFFGAFPEPRGGQTPQEAVLQLEATLGRKLAAVRVYDLWDTPFPSPYVEWLRDTGHIVVLSVKALRTNKSRIRWIDIANAQPGSPLHNDMVNWASRVRDFGGPVWFIFNHEPEERSNDASGSAQDFIAAWRKMIGIFRQQGAVNAKYVWVATSYAFERTDGRRAALWYPGDAYVDAIGADPYNWYNCRPGINNPWRSLQEIIEPMRLFGLAHPNKELMLTEFGSFEDPANIGRKGQWFNGAQQLFQQPGWEQFTAILYYNTGGNATYPNCRWLIDTSPSSLEAFRLLANDPFYGRSSTPDLLEPSVPGQPTGVSDTPGSISLAWAASMDDIAQNLEYHVYRDGGAVPVGVVVSASPTAVSFTDTGLVAGSTHTYEVTASDGTNTSSRSPASDPITVAQEPPSIFTDDFSAGDFSRWTATTRLSIDASQGSSVAPSARAQVVSQSAFAYRMLGATYGAACMSMDVSVSALGTNAVDLFRLRTASDGPISRAFVNASGVLHIRSDFSGVQRNSGVALGAGWHNVELCGTIGATGAWNLYRDGLRIVSGWIANTGATPIGRIQIGDNAAKSFTANFDDIRLDSSPG